MDSTYTVGNDVGVAVETSLGVTVRGLVAGKIPDDEGLVARSREKHVRAGCQLVFCRNAATALFGERTSQGRSRGR